MCHIKGLQVTLLVASKAESGWHILAMALPCIRYVTVVLKCFTYLSALHELEAFEMRNIYCVLSENCECDFKGDVRGLEWDLYKNLYGQHLAQDLVSELLAGFLRKKNPDRPLVLSLHGASGTGKTMVSSMVGRHLYGTAMGSPHIHQFIPTLHFSRADQVPLYKRELKRWVEGNLTSCARSVFIFDEMEKMPPGVVDVLVPFLGPDHVLFQTNYRKAIYIFISTAGEDIINQVTLKAKLAGQDREEIEHGDLEALIRDALFDKENTGFYLSNIIKENLISSFVPFLPLTRKHVERCARRELCQRRLCHRTDVMEKVGGSVLYTLMEGHQFSSTGCKSIPAKVNLFL